MDVQFVCKCNLTTYRFRAQHEDGLENKISFTQHINKIIEGDQMTQASVRYLAHLLSTNDMQHILNEQIYVYRLLIIAS